MLNKSFGGLITRSGSADVSTITSPTRKVRATDHVELLSEKLRDYKAENQLLGRLLQDMKAEQDRTAEHIAGLRRQLADTSARAERAESQLEKSQSLSQRSVEDLAEARSAQERAYKEVGELKARLAEAQTALASSQREVGALQARLDGAERAGREGESARLQAEALQRESETKLREVGDLKARLREAEDRVDELESLKRAWREEWDRVKSGHRQQVADLSAAVQALQSKLRESESQREAEKRRAAAAEEQAGALARRVAQLETERGAERREMGVERAREVDRAKDAERLRGAVAAATQRAEQLALANAELTQDIQGLTQRLRDAEEALGQTRAVMQSQSAQLADANHRTLTDALAAAAAGANADAVARMGISGRPDSLGSSPLDTYVRVLEHSLKEQMSQGALQRSQLEEAHYLESQARQLLSESRAKEAEAHKRLQTELRRVHALERMRLQDMAEIQDLAKQLHQSRQELWNTRETLGAERARTEQGQQGPYLPLPSARPTPARSYPQVALGRGGGGSHHEASVGRGFQTPRGTVGGVVDGMSSVGLD